tara:strand:- start:15955 stop:16104 length:150 start_codon:yes stop_codon:yes gene_type:complete
MAVVDTRIDAKAKLRELFMTGDDLTPTVIVKILFSFVALHFQGGYFPTQ